MYNILIISHFFIKHTKWPQEYQTHVMYSSPYSLGAPQIDMIFTLYLLYKVYNTPLPTSIYTLPRIHNNICVGNLLLLMFRCCHWCQPSMFYWRWLLVQLQSFPLASIDVVSLVIWWFFSLDALVCIATMEIDRIVYMLILCCWCYF